MRLVYLACGWVVGIFIESQYPQIPIELWMLGLGLSGVIFVALLRYPHHRWVTLALIATMLGGIRQSFTPTSSDIAQYNGTNGTVSGIVISEPDIRDDHTQLRVLSSTIFSRNDTLATSGRVLVKTSTLTNVHYGDYIRATGALDTPATWDTFSYADYLAREGVFTVMPNAAVEVIASDYGNPLFATLFDLKQRVQTQIAGMLPEPQAGLLTGILLGNERGISPQLADDFSRVGASHVIAISGFNMVVISALIMRGLQHALGKQSTIALVSGITIIIVYTLFVGASPAIIRAAFMSSLLIIADYLNRKTYVPASLAFVTLVLSLFNPAVLQDIGFQLSFLAVLGLALFADPLSTLFWDFLEQRLPYRSAKMIHIALNEPLIVSIVAQITTLPLIILYFGRLSLLSVIVNILIVPVQSYILILGFLAVLITLVTPNIGLLIYWLDMVFLSWTIACVRLYAQVKSADIIIHIDPRIIQTSYLLLFGGSMISATQPAWWIRLTQFMRQQAVLVTLATMSFAIGVLMLGMVMSRPNGELHVWMLDMGHSNAVLIQTPNGAHMLIDGGRFPSRLLTALGDRMPYYDRDIEILAITHPDALDIGALTSVLERYNIGVALWNGQPNRTSTWLDIQNKLTTTQMIPVRAGYTLTLDDGVSIEVLHPQSTPPISDPLGDHAMVLRLRHGNVSIVLPSDITPTGQAEMLAYGISPTASILQLPNHATQRALDSDWLTLAQPQVAVIQSDRANRRGDPNPDTVAMLGNIPIFRTDTMGTIHIVSDGQTIRVTGE